MNFFRTPLSTATVIVSALLGCTASVARSADVSYRLEVIPVLAKHGCNTAECHGSPSGKGGFQLSLWGHDPAKDLSALADRADTATPADSLILQKPTLKEKHGGGRRFTDDELGYQVLRDWIAGGCKSDAEGGPKCTSIEVSPSVAAVVKLPGKLPPLRVLARFDDGSLRDVTALATYSSTGEEIAQIDLLGRVIGRKRGEATVIVRFLEHLHVVPLTFVEDVPGFVWSDPPAANYIDERVHAKLRQLAILPAPTCSDEEFVRRVYLDVIGLLPEVAEVRAFLDDTAADKRAKLIDRLLARPEHAKFFAQRWADMVQLTSARLGRDAALAYYAWLEKGWADNVPYDQFARELLTADGNTRERPAANFFRMGDDPFELMEAASQVLLGTQIGCAKCHNHPVERWTRNEYYGLSHFFHRIERKKDDPRKDEFTVRLSAAAEVRNPDTQQLVPPWLPGETKTDLADSDDPRQVFARWLTRPDNGYGPRVEVNRLWSWLLGRGIVDPPEDFRLTNPPANPELLDALTKDFSDHKFDRRHLLRTILNSRTYQASTRTNPFNAADTRYFSRHMPRKLTAEQTLDAVSYVTGVAESFKGLPEGTKATQLAAPDLTDNEFLRQFGQPMRSATCQCERPQDAGLGAALAMHNGRLIHDKLRSDKSRLRDLLKREASDEEIVGEFYLAAFARQPSAAEKAAALKFVNDRPNRRQSLEDVLWAIMNTHEFLYQH